MKRKILILLAPAALLFASCEKSIDELAKPGADAAAFKKEMTTSPIVFNETNLFPEGVEYDPFNNYFLVSSTTRGDVGIVKPDGSYTAFITDPALTSSIGLQVDKARRTLWVANGPEGVGIYDLSTGDRIAYANLAELIPGAPIFINDIAIDPQGNAYVTNSAYPVIYKVSPDGEAMVWQEFPSLALPAGSFGFNGIEYANQGYLLVAYTAGNAVYKIPVSDPQSFSSVTFDAALNRPDGLLLSKDGKSLVVVNNAGGAAGKVLTFSSTNMWQSGMLESSFSTGNVFPTTATSNGKNVFVLYAYLHERSIGRSEFSIQPVPMEMKTTF